MWDFKTLQLVHRLSIHKERVQSIAFSPNDQYLASLGGREDNGVLLWDLASGQAGVHQLRGVVAACHTHYHHQ